VTIDPHLIRPNDIARNKVSPAKAAAGLGWKARLDMAAVISLMLEAEIARLRGGAG
jgi:GDP-D-mannose dehydratase